MDKRNVTNEEVLAVLNEWSFRKNPDRRNVMPEGEDHVPSETFGLIRTRTGLWVDSRCSQEFPYIPKLLNRWLKGRLMLHPELWKDWKCSSITVNGGFASKRHRDENNVGPSAIRAFWVCKRGRPAVLAKGQRERTSTGASDAGRGPPQRWQP